MISGVNNNDDMLQSQDPNSKRKKVNNEGFLDIGSVSWSIMLAAFFLKLHDDDTSFCITFGGIIDILEVLKHEFGNMVPLENQTEILTS